MADWSKPTVTSNYVTFVDEVKTRDIDAITLQLNVVTSPPTGAIKLLRSPVKFQEWDGAAFVDRVLAPSGGGTGLTALTGLSGAMGLGTMSLQNTSGFNIGPGTIANLSLTGNLNFSGGNAAFSSTTTTAVSVSGPASVFVMVVDGSSSSLSHGLLVRAGLGNSSEYSFCVQNKGATLNGLVVRGDMSVICSKGLVIPVGTDVWVP